MRLFVDARQALHDPVRELHNGDWVTYAESADRVRLVQDQLPGWEGARDFGVEPLLAVHVPAYLAFLQRAHADWLAAGRSGDAIGYAFPVVGRRPLKLGRIDAELGSFSFDASTPIAAGTWESAYWGAQAALTALETVIGGDRAAFALCRPPGHHAGSDYMGGYCYLNNAAIVARAAQAKGHARVAILDIDYHHGNGTQDIFYDDGSVFFASIHADPATDYPYFWGHADEVGEGPGQGTTLNVPLPRDMTFEPYVLALDSALAAIAGFGPTMLVLSFGADTYEKDPISHFKLGRADYTAVAARIAALGLPTLIVMEGGYAVADLPSNISAFLAGFDRLPNATVAD
ncbi:MAG: histone deacetylase family protein [Sandarakinorhabdus sp.]|nr:histone deacetylase family protein [Sandarakinorhabdus sp.]